MKDYDVATVITVRNGGATIKEAVLSSLNQPGVRSQTIVIDDGSTDDTSAVLSRVDHPDLTVHRSGLIGRPAALNLGIRLSHTPLIAILDADDRSHPGRLALQQQVLSMDEGLQVLGGQVLTFTSSDERPAPSVRLQFPCHPDAVDKRLLRGRMPLAHPTMIFRRSWFESTGGYDPSCAAAEDFDLILRGWRPKAYASLPVAVTDYQLRGPFPTWAYWRRSEAYRRAIVRRWRRDSSTQIEEPRLAVETLADFVRWSAQRVWSSRRGC